MHHLSECEMDKVAIRIIELLNDVPMGQALAILEKKAPLLLKDSHVVNTHNERFITLKGNLEIRDHVSA